LQRRRPEIDLLKSPSLVRKIMISESVDPARDEFWEAIIQKGMPGPLASAPESAEQLRKLGAIEQLSGVITHDFNNLMQVIVSALRIIERRGGSERTGDISFLMASAIQAADKATRLTHRLLSAATAASDRASPIEINDLLINLKDRLTELTGNRINLEFLFLDDFIELDCDARQLQSAILNLVANAVDAIEGRGCVKIETSLANLTVNHLGLIPGRYLALAVVDTGKGMDSSLSRRIFDPFCSTKRSGDRCGLGLPSVKAFVEQQGGFLQVDSAPSQGTCVRMYLPGAVRLTKFDQASSNFPST
jgi:signal transduction histidine kinase